MSPVLVVLGSFVLYWLGYRYYGRWLSTRVFRLDPDAVTPAHELEDGVDYVPTRPAVLFGHHYASITGLAPMLGPAVAVIWGWLPSLLWVVLGTIFVGAVHDFAALVVSARARGMSMGKVAEGVVGPRARTLFHFIIFFGVALAMGVFVYVIARLFSTELVPGHPGYPQAVMPSGLLMIIAVIAGYLLYRKGVALMPVAVVGFLVLVASIAVSPFMPTMGIDPAAWPGPATWTYVLLLYAFLASVLPVWTLLQSRDFLNSLLLYLGMGLAYVGLFVANPAFDAPAIVAEPEGAPPLLPFVFIVIACGAASGFHGLVSSGTTAKQLDRETDAHFIGFGGMIGESLLGLLATVACTTGFGSPALWHDHYSNWKSADGLATKIDAFIQGTTLFVTKLGVSEELAASLIAMVVVSFALTSLDSATRLLRFNIEEIGHTFRIPFSQNRYVSSVAACAAIGFFAMYEVGGRPAALALWQLFGTTNQMLAGLTLGTAALYLRQRGWLTWPVALPAVFILGSTMTAMVANLRDFAVEVGDPLLLGVGGIIFALALWLLVEAGIALVKLKPADGPRVEYES